MTTKQNLSADQLPILPETHPNDPLVQCGVLYLGSAPASVGLRSIESIQEPFSHRYPVDGTNTVRGIDAILSVYHNGIQLAFTRQPYAVVFFPISSLVYCASLRFTIIESDQSNITSLVDWRFMPLDSVPNTDSKHPPLFCAVIRRTQILEGDECHCFITKSPDAAIALVQTISEIYSTLQSHITNFKAPIFYQLDRYGRKLSEITGIIYLSPDNEDDIQQNRKKSNRLTDKDMLRTYLLDSSSNGYFYRTDASLIEQWQLWDDDENRQNTRPHPPPSPFGLHEGLYHDDTTHEIHRYLRRMDEDEKLSCSCYSSSSQNSTSSSSTECSRQQQQQYSHINQPDQFNSSLLNQQTSSFEPVLSRHTHCKHHKPPIIIEKILPKSKHNTTVKSKPISYRINKHGEKITDEGNRIVFMDVVQMNSTEKTTKSSIPQTRRIRSRRSIPMINLESLERLYDNETHQISTPNQFDIIEQYFEDKQGRKYQPNNLTIQSLLNQTQSIHLDNNQRRTSLQPTISSKSQQQHQRSQSTLTKGTPINYAERPTISSLTHSQHQTPVLNNIKLDEYITNIYGTTGSVKSNSSKSTKRNSSAFRHVQTNVDRNLLKEYRNIY